MIIFQTSKPFSAGPKYRGCYIVAIDGTGVSTYSHKHCEYCLHKKSGSGVVTWSHNVLEAKLLTPTGLSLSIATEWISIEGRANYQKQDCEQAAFKRLSIKIKKMFPRLPIIIIADGLYPTQGFFDICKRNNWHYVVTRMGICGCFRRKLRLKEGLYQTKRESL